MKYYTFVQAIDQSVEVGSSIPLVGTRLHDFGFRGSIVTKKQQQEAAADHSPGKG